MSTDLLKQLLEAGVHYGHQTKRWNPKMARFIFGQKEGIYIIDLEKTQETIREAQNFLKELAARGEEILFVGTKRQAQEIVKAEAIRCGMYYITRRWLGGILTNFSTIQKSIKRYEEIKRMEEDGTMTKLSKKEAASLNKEKEKLYNVLGGIVKMKKLPAAIFVIDSKQEDIAVKEANKLEIPVVAVIDTNSNPDLIAYPIPGNDDAIRSIRLLTTLITDSIVEGRGQCQKVIKEKEEKLAKEELAEKANQESAPATTLPDEEIEQIAAKEVVKKLETKEDVTPHRKKRTAKTTKTTKTK